MQTRLFFKHYNVFFLLLLFLHFISHIAFFVFCCDLFFAVVCFICGMSLTIKISALNVLCWYLFSWPSQSQNQYKQFFSSWKIVHLNCYITYSLIHPFLCELHSARSYQKITMHFHTWNLWLVICDSSFDEIFLWFCFSFHLRINEISIYFLINWTVFMWFQTERHQIVHTFT